MKTMGALRPFKRFSIILFALIAFLVGCSNALQYEVAKLTDEQRTAVRQILTSEQLEKLDNWINRNATTNRGIPRGVTVQQAIKDQDGWLANKNVEEATSAQLRKQAQAELAAIQVEFASDLTVSLLTKKNQVQVDGRRFVTLEIAYSNRTDKAIQGVKGILKLRDTYGNPVIDVSLSNDRGISAMQTVIDHDADVPIDQLSEPQVNLWNTDFDKLKYTFEARSITFNDGTSMSAPK